jgi:hypothetical protein
VAFNHLELSRVFFFFFFILYLFFYFFLKRMVYRQLIWKLVLFKGIFFFIRKNFFFLDELFSFYLVVQEQSPENYITH